jgi:acid phosphatase type 7
MKEFRLRRGSILAVTTAAVLAATTARAAATLTRGPYLQSLLGTSVVVMWSTGAPSTGKVRWKAPDGASGEASEPAPVAEHRVSISGLVPGASYRYAVMDGATAISEEFAFRTAPPPGEGPVKIAVAGDTGSGDIHEADVAAVIEGMHADLFVHTGDFDYLYDVDRAVFDPYGTTLPRTCFYPSMGNDHDPNQDWPTLFTLPFDAPREVGIYYSFDWGPVHFTAIDTQIGLDEGSPQRTWIEADLTAARERRVPWLVLFFHRPPYTVGRYSSGTLLAKTLEIRAAIEPVVERFGVDLVLNGHDHNYQRTYPVKQGAAVASDQEPHYASPGGCIYVVTGGGGRTLYSESATSDHGVNRIYSKTFHAVELVISSLRIDARAIADSGTVIDSFSIEKGAPFIRGDADGSGSIAVADAIAVLEILFRSTAPPPCLDRLDVNGDGAVDVSDPIYLLVFRYGGGGPPPSPYPQCGSPPQRALPCDTATCIKI